MHPTLGLPVAVLLAGAAGCLLLRRGPGRPTASAPWLPRHPRPDTEELARPHQQALRRLMERHQLKDPFRLLIYAGMPTPKWAGARDEDIMTTDGQANPGT
jgi:hypothetical protein